MTGNIMAHLSQHRRPVPFVVMFKSVIGFAVAGIVVVGAILAFVGASAHVELTLQILAAVAGAALGAYGALRAGRDASAKR